MLGSGSPRRGRGRQSPRAPSHARAAALLSRPRGRLEDHTGTRRVSPAKQRLELQDLCRPEPDLHPTLGCQPEERAFGANAGEGLGCRCQQAHTTALSGSSRLAPVPPVLGRSVCVLQSLEKCGWN